MQYFFILGRNPELSRAELHALLPDGYTAVAYSHQVLIMECAALDISALMKRLGGTIKAGEIVSHTPYPVSPTVVLGLLEKTPSDKKLFLGLSAYALDAEAHLPNIHTLRQLGIAIKRGLQEQGYKVRLVTSKEIALASVIVKREKLLSQGTEIVMFYDIKQSLTPNTYSLTPRYIGKTLAVQEFAEASIRDFGRPEREMKVGMLPVQLAKIMINLSRTPLNGTILDPFCGFGTVLSEALAMGYTNLIGSDSEQKMIVATRKNLEWLTKDASFSNSRELENVKLLAAPVEQLSKHLPPHCVDAIVTEPYLGPTAGMKNEELRMQNELVRLYIKAFEQFSKILKPTGRVVFILPAFKHGVQITKTSDRVLPEIKKLGFKPIQLLPNPYSLALGPSITYSRPDQRVLREIFALEFKP